MKKIMLLLMLFFAMPLCVFATSVDTDELKGKLGLPLYYVKTAQNIEMDDNSSYVSISWSGELGGKGGTVSVKVDEAGRIFYYNGYEYGNFGGDFHLSSFNSTEASKLALSRLKELCPEFANEVEVKKEDEYILRTSEYYPIKFIRYVNGIPYYSNYITASVHAGTGTLVEFNVVWDDIDKNDFPKPAAYVKPDKAREYYKKNIGLSLTSTKAANGEFVLQYYPNITGSTYISAYTGEAIKTNIKSGKYAYDTSLFVKSITTPKRSVISYSDGDEFKSREAILRKKIELTDEFVLSGVAVQENEIGTKYLLFVFEDGNGATVTAEMSLLTNEVTLYLKTFSENKTYSGTSKEKAKMKALAFAKKVGSQRYKNCSEPISYDGYTYLFRRVLEDGTECTDNGMAITIDSVTGDVSSYVCSWGYNGFNGLAKKISESKAYNEIFSRGKYFLMYVAVAKTNKKDIEKTDDIEVALVYGFNPEIPVFVDAVSGKLVYSDNSMYTEDIKTGFGDISSHPSKKHIKRLVDAGIIDVSNKFNPDEYITQADYFKLLYRAVKNDKTSDITEIYNKFLYEYGVIEENEISENSELSFETAIKYAVRILGYREVAELENVYLAPFVDEASISPELVGYAAISKGLGIVKGNAFMPKQTLTKAIAAEIVYNTVSSNK